MPDNVVSLDEAVRRAQAKAAEAPGPFKDAPWQFLGHDHGRYYFLPHGAKQVASLTADNLKSDAHLLRLAPVSFWEREFPPSSNGKWPLTAIANGMIRHSETVGVFDPDRIRGRGVWFDDGRTVMHMGDRLAIGRDTIAIGELDSDYIYEQAIRFDMPVDAEPLSNKEAYEVYRLAAQLQWERPYQAKLFAGWLALACVCGALKWRPHIFLCGESGSGKTWVQESIVLQLLGPLALAVQSKTTEPGIRRALGSDARPVIFDEAEAEAVADRVRIQRVLDLARQASSEGGPGIIQADGATGRAVVFRVRSAFCFASIRPPLAHQADETRITVLPLVSPRAETPEARAARAAQFEALEAATTKLLTPEYSARFFARSLYYIKTIRANAATYARAAAKIASTKRIGDQLGALMAGYKVLLGSTVVTDEQATAEILQDGWYAEASADAVERPDHERLLDAITQHIVTVRKDGGNTYTRSIGELVRVAGRLVPGDGVDATMAETELTRLGLRVEALPQGERQPGDDTEYLWIANIHTALGRILADTAWPNNWGRVLANYPNAVKSKNGIRFGGPQSRATGVPLAVFVTDS